jgi:hypothetical protein
LNITLSDGLVPGVNCVYSVNVLPGACTNDWVFNVAVGVVLDALLLRTFQATDSL